MAKQPEFRKYIPLEAWFRDQPSTVEQIELSFDQVEAILGSALPKSATRLPTWWTNVEPKIQSHRTAWLNNGWKVTEFDQQARWVKFIRERPSMMKKNVLFIQGGGEGAYAADKKLAASLQEILGAEYQVHYPMMPNEADPEYETYKTQIAKELASLDGPIALVGHSMGGTVLLRYLTEEKVEKSLAGIFLVAVPYWTAEDWFDGHRLHKNLASPSHKTTPFFFYHSRDDPVVPFEHMAMYAAKIPQAAIHEFDGRGHQFHDNLSEVAADILSLSIHS